MLPNDLQNQFSHLTFPKTHSTLAVMKRCVSSILHTSSLMVIDQRLEEREGDCRAAIGSVPLNDSPLYLPVDSSEVN